MLGIRETRKGMAIKWETPFRSDSTDAGRSESGDGRERGCLPFKRSCPGAYRRDDRSAVGSVSSTFSAVRKCTTAFSYGKRTLLAIMPFPRARKRNPNRRTQSARSRDNASGHSSAVPNRALTEPRMELRQTTVAGDGSALPLLVTPRCR
jgi:hypothetical protein